MQIPQGNQNFKYFSTRHPLKPSTSFCETLDGRYDKGEFLVETKGLYTDEEKSTLYKFEDAEHKVKKVVKEVLCYEDDLEKRKQEVDIYRQVHGFCEMEVFPISDSKYKEAEFESEVAEGNFKASEKDENIKLIRVITDYIDGETLTKKLSKTNDPYELFTLLFNVVAAIKDFNLKWRHGDLHGGNILIDAKGKVFLIDFYSVTEADRYCDNLREIRFLFSNVLNFKKDILSGVLLQTEMTALMSVINEAWMQQMQENEKYSSKSIYNHILNELAFLQQITSLDKKPFTSSSLPRSVEESDVDPKDFLLSPDMPELATGTTTTGSSGLHTSGIGVFAPNKESPSAGPPTPAVSMQSTTDEKPGKSPSG
jgi:hypothetical protein